MPHVAALATEDTLAPESPEPRTRAASAATRHTPAAPAPATPKDMSLRVNTSPQDPLGRCPGTHNGWGLTVRHGMLAHHALQRVFAQFEVDRGAHLFGRTLARNARFMLSSGDFPFSTMPLARDTADTDSPSPRLARTPSFPTAGFARGLALPVRAGTLSNSSGSLTSPPKLLPAPSSAGDAPLPIASSPAAFEAAAWATLTMHSAHVTLSSTGSAGSDRGEADMHPGDLPNSASTDAAQSSLFPSLSAPALPSLDIASPSLTPPTPMPSLAESTRRAPRPARAPALAFSIQAEHSVDHSTQHSHGPPPNYLSNAANFTTAPLASPVAEPPRHHTLSLSNANASANAPALALEPVEPQRRRRSIDPALPVAGPALASPAVHVRGVPIPLSSCAARDFAMQVNSSADGVALALVPAEAEGQQLMSAETALPAAASTAPTAAADAYNEHPAHQPPAEWFLPSCAIVPSPPTLISDDPAAAADPVWRASAQRSGFGCCGLAVDGGVGLYQQDDAFHEKQKRKAQRLRGEDDRDRVKRLKQLAAEQAGERDKWGFAFKDPAPIQWCGFESVTCSCAVAVAAAVGEEEAAAAVSGVTVPVEVDRARTRNGEREGKQRANDVTRRPPGWFLFTLPRTTPTRRCCGLVRPPKSKNQVSPLVVPQCVYWLAPEAIRAEPIGVKADVYSTACVLWEAAHRRVPYRDLEALVRTECRRDTLLYGQACDEHYLRTGRSPPPSFMEYLCVSAEDRLARAIAWAHYRPHINATVPPALRGIIRRMWHPDPQARPHAALALLWVRVAYARFCARMDFLLMGRRAGDWYLWDQTVREAAWQRVDLAAVEAQVAAMEEEEELMERAAARAERERQGRVDPDEDIEVEFLADEFGFRYFGCCCGCETANLAAGCRMPKHLRGKMFHRK